MNTPKIKFAEAARRAGFSTATLRRLVADGDGPAVYRLGRRWFVIDPADLESWVASRRINTTTTELTHLIRETAPERLASVV
jgi:predicted DNA-binding transcriptional regulator AlpA